jgi:competence protein ComEA
MKKFRITFLTPSEQKVLFFLLFFISLGAILSLFNYTPKQRQQLHAIESQRAALDSLLTIDFIPRFDLLTVSYDELLYISGIGPSLATSIIEYRETHGFTSLEELLNIRGIGESRLAQFREYLYIESDVCKSSVQSVPSILRIDTPLDLNQINSPRCSPTCSLVHINTASASELMTLRGIGEVRARDIINHRESVGRFNKKEDIKIIRGIGETTFENLKDNICVGT